MKKELTPVEIMAIETTATVMEALYNIDRKKALELSMSALYESKGRTGEVMREIGYCKKHGKGYFKRDGREGIGIYCPICHKEEIDRYKAKGEV